MYAVVQTGGKQYRVTPGDYVIVERLPGENGDNVELNDVLLIDNDGKVLVGQPFVKDASVTATIVNQNRADKIIVFKKKRRQGYRRKNGHRQLQSVLHIGAIKGDGKTVKAENTPKVSTPVEAPAPKLTRAAKIAIANGEAPKATEKAAVKKTVKAEKPAKTEAVQEAKAAAPKKEAAEKKPAPAKKPAAKKTTDK
ncbi:MAG: 50S ribosomal protein L21 [Alphaproteobacteria bacterium]|nr:50S ribosomal protein L21 [Alphaproteobacteria bacterium]